MHDNGIYEDKEKQAGKQKIGEAEEPHKKKEQQAQCTTK
jgi:hypothetical protein